MKKKLTALFLAVVMCMTLGVPAFASEDNTSDEFVPVLAEGETWHPANGIMTCEDDNCRKGHTGPAGWEYCGYIEGNSKFDTLVNNTILTITGFIDGIGIITIVLGSYLDYEDFMDTTDSEGHAKLDYHKHIYRSSNNNMWYHIIWYYRDADDGLMRYLTCDTYPNY